MRAIGIILAGGNNHRMKELSSKRAIAAMPVAGSYRSIDFSLSNMSNSHVQKVAVLTQYNSRSLNEHLSSSKWWDFGRKQGGLYIFTPTVTAENSYWYRGTADAIWQNIDWLKQSHEPYVVIASGDGVYKMDYNKVLEYHIDKKADITVVCKEMPQGADLSRFGAVKADDNGRIIDFEEKPMATDAHMVSCGIYIIRRRQLIELIEKCAQEDRFDFVRDILIRYKNVKKIYSYKIDSYWNSISSVESYYETNMGFLKPEVRKHFLQDCLDSLLQSTVEIAVIVVDNGSTDGTVSWIQERFPQVKLICFSENKGFCTAVNTGIEAAATPYVFLLNNDTKPDRFCLERLERAMEADEKIFSVGAKMLSMKEPELVDTAGDLYSAFGWAYAIGKGRPSSNYTAPKRVFSNCAGAALYRKAHLEQIGGFDELTWKMWISDTGRRFSD